MKNFKDIHDSAFPLYDLYNDTLAQDPLYSGYHDI